MINTAWMMVILFGMAALLAAGTRRKIENWFAFAAFAVIAVLYGFALAGKPVWGYHAVRALGAASMLGTAVLAAVRRDLRKWIFTPGAAVFAVVMVFAWWGHRGQVYVQQDEFTHWGRAVKQLYQLEVLPSSVAGALDYPSYPPGSTLLYTFFSWLGGGFSEGITITASNVLLVSCMIPVMQFASWRRWKRIIPLAFVCVMLPMVYHPGVYQDIYVDVLLGCVAAYALMAWIFDGSSRSSLLRISASVLVLPLIKASGTALAVLVLVLIALELRKTDRKQLRKLLIPLACMLVSVVSWSLFRRFCGVVGEKSFQPAAILDNIKGALNGTSPWFQRYLFFNFFRFITMPSMMGGGHILSLSYVEWLLVYAAVACWMKRSAEKLSLPEKNRAGSLVWMLIFSTILYAVMLFHLYLYTFEAWEAAGLHSFDRYMSTVMTVLAAVTAALLEKRWQHCPPRPLPSTMILLICAVLFVNPLGLAELTFSAPLEIESRQALRSELLPSQAAAEIPDEQEKIAWMAETLVGDNEFLPYIVNRYEFMPAQVEKPFGNLMGQTPAENVRKTLEQGEYLYVYCYTVNENFAARYGELFEDPSSIAGKTLYKVAAGEQGVVLQRLH